MNKDCNRSSNLVRTVLDACEPCRLLVLAIIIFSCWTPVLTARDFKQNEPQSKGQSAVSDLPTLVDQIIRNRDDAPKLSLKLGKRALGILRESPNPKLELQVRMQLSWVESRKGNTEHGLEYAERALELAEQIGDAKQEAIANYHIALAYWYDGKADDAVAACERACWIQEHEGHNVELAKSLTLLGAIHRSRSAYQDSLIAHQRALTISEEIDDPAGVARSKNNIGLVHWRLENHERAFEYINAVIPYYRTSGSKSKLAQALSNLGLIQIELSQPNKALEFLEQAIQLQASNSPTRCQAKILANIAYAYEKLDDLDRALDYYRQALEIRKSMNDRWGCARSMGQIGNIQALKGLHLRAVDSFQQGLTYATQCDAKDEQSALHKLIATSYRAAGDHKNAFTAFQAHSAIEDELQRAETARRIAEIEAEWEMAEQQTKLEALERSKAEQSLAIARQRESQWLLIAVFATILSFAGVVLIVGQARAMRTKKRSYEKLNLALEHLKESEHRYRSVFESSIVPKFLIDFENDVVLELNKAAQEHFHLVPNEIKQSNVKSLEPNLLSKILTSVQIDESEQRHHLHLGQEGESHFVTSTSPVTLNGQSCAIVTVQDVTERQRREEDRIRLEKLESLGLMAGGIAHDFKNALTAVLAYVGLARNKSDNDSEVAHFLERAELAGEQAEWLTSQLVTFAKTDSPEHKQHQLDKLLVESIGLVSSGSNVDVEFELATSLPPLIVDEGQFKQVISNIAINAHQAMESGGRLVVRAETHTARYQLGPVAPEGEYIRIDIQDSGPGVPIEIRDKILDPYYTTKDFGTGLGLSTAFAIVQQHHGHMEFHSDEGKGTTFSIYFPVFQQATDELAQMPG